MPTPARTETISFADRLTEPCQCASRVLMVRPRAFARNDAAARTNAFMLGSTDPGAEVARRATAEFDALARALTEAGVEVVIDEESELPDSVFPNNWLSFHQPTGRRPVLITYPMATPARRLERRVAVLDRIAAMHPGGLDRIDLESLEDTYGFLEGTGSLVLDRVGGVAFACRSERTTDRGLDAWAEATGCEVVRFDAADADGTPVYHTNVMLSIGDRFSAVCAESIGDMSLRAAVTGRLRETRPVFLDLSHDQMRGMCANILELRTRGGQPVLAMSRTAWDGFSHAQQGTLSSLARPVVAEIPTIERVGGGSVRCMIAELGRGVFTKSS